MLSLQMSMLQRYYLCILSSVLLWRSEGQWMCRGGAGQPLYRGSPCPCRQDYRSISQLNACFIPGKYKIRDDWLEHSIYHKRYLLFCFVVTRFHLCRTKCFFSPWMKGLLFIPLNAIVLRKALSEAQSEMTALRYTDVLFLLAVWADKGCWVQQLHLV